MPGYKGELKLNCFYQDFVCRIKKKSDNKLQ